MADTTDDRTSDVKPVLTLSFDIQGRDFKASGEASHRIKRTLEQVGLDWSVIRRAAVVLYEAEMNIVIHATRGVLKAEISPSRLTIVAEDEGPGIPDIELAMQEGYSTAPEEIKLMGFGAGMGLPNIKEHADSLEIETEVGKGTRLVAVIDVPEGGAESQA
ncbi:MAG TPA: anti-sigma regulatory factor [Clostridiales bacterium]|nr:anti-sigma regulatory factor [Clostridiales bacterium]